MCDIDDHAPTICPVTGAYCVRAFCEDYGCANQADVPIDANDIACGSEDIDETAPRLPGSSIRPRKRRPNTDQFSLL